MPVSRTSKTSRSAPPRRTTSLTSPCGVNLTALVSRFSSTWRSRVGSVSTASGSSAGASSTNDTLFSAARNRTTSMQPLSSGRSRTGRASTLILPASILEKSRMSLITVISASAESRMVWACSRWSGFSGVSSNSPLMPITPFMGVRISWLIVARKALLAWLAASAAARAADAASAWARAWASCTASWRERCTWRQARSTMSPTKIVGKPTWVSTCNQPWG
mmetsp:Transcript_21109/g.81936  ORF Transcript_21109/g.81936 Transcript_21109/m.81936 type:complete len:221 (-) Transcript_21109:3398-4060(-)